MLTRFDKKKVGSTGLLTVVNGRVPAARGPSESYTALEMQLERIGKCWMKFLERSRFRGFGGFQLTIWYFGEKNDTSRIKQKVVFFLMSSA